MNIIRTRAVELSTIPAIAYRQKLATGGSGVKILRIDQNVSAVGTIDRRTGEAVPYGKIDANLFPVEAFDEALELLTGLPYSARGNITVKPVEVVEEEDVVEEKPEKVDMVGSEEYQAIVDRYSDENGKMNYRLMNKDFIQFCSRSKTVSEMIANGSSADDILIFIVQSRATFISGKKESLSNELVSDLIETLDEINPRSAFKELSAHIRRMLSRK